MIVSSPYRFITRWRDSGRIMDSYALFQQWSESPLEKYFWHFFHKCVGPFRLVAPQYNIENYRLDGFFQTNTHRIGIELDGAAFHDPIRDTARDKKILASGLIDEIIRIPFAAMNYYSVAVFRVLSHWHAEFAFLSWDSSVMSWCDFVSDLERPPYGMTQNEYLAWHEPNTEVYDVEETYGFACSPNTAISRMSETSRLKYITRRKRG